MRNQILPHNPLVNLDDVMLPFLSHDKNKEIKTLKYIFLDVYRWRVYTRSNFFYEFETKKALEKTEKKDLLQLKKC